MLRLSKFHRIALAVTVTVGVVVLIAAFFIEREAETHVQHALAKALLAAPPQAQFEYDSVSVSLLRRSVRLDHVRTARLRIDHVRIWGLDWDSLVRIVQTRKAVLPQDLKVELSGLHVTPDLIGDDGAALLQMLGYEEISANIYASMSIDRAKKTLDLKDFVAQADHLGSFEAEAAIGGFMIPSPEEIDRLKKDPRLLLTDTAEFTRATLKNFRLSYSDDSFVKRASTALIQNGEDSPEALVRLALEVNEPSPRTIASNPRSNDFTKPALEKLLAFMQKPTTITLTATPPAPIPFLSLLDDQTSGSINDLAHRLNLKVQ